MKVRLFVPVAIEHPPRVEHAAERDTASDLFGMARREVHRVEAAHRGAVDDRVAATRARRHHREEFLGVHRVDAVVARHALGRMNRGVVPGVVAVRVDATDLKLPAFDLVLDAVHEMKILVLPVPPGGGGKRHEGSAAVAKPEVLDGTFQNPRAEAVLVSLHAAPKYAFSKGNLATIGPL
jgi:hypothetical protein